MLSVAGVFVVCSLSYVLVVFYMAHSPISSSCRHAASSLDSCRHVHLSPRPDHAVTDLSLILACRLHALTIPLATYQLEQVKLRLLYDSQDNPRLTQSANLCLQN